jgi:hypothetical protein
MSGGQGGGRPGGRGALGRCAPPRGHPRRSGRSGCAAPAHRWQPVSSPYRLTDVLGGMFDRLGWLGVALRAGLSCCASSRRRRLAPGGLQSLTPSRRGRRCAWRPLGEPDRAGPARLAMCCFRRFSCIKADVAAEGARPSCNRSRSSVQARRWAWHSFILRLGGPVQDEDFARPGLNFLGGGQC